MMPQSSWTSLEGSPFPLGAAWVGAEQAFNFAIFSETAATVRLLFFSEQDYGRSLAEFDFDPRINKTGPVWHARISQSSITGAQYYAYSIDGPAPGAESSLSFFRPNKLLIDPYAKAIFIPPTYERAAAYGDESNFGKAPLSVLPSSDPPFDWEDDHPPRHEHDLVVYELHVRGFTKAASSAVSAHGQGTFSGIIEKIPYLKSLGITAVELMPVFAFDQTEPNYWGYMPLGFFAPYHAYSSDNSVGQPITEFKQMVKALHRADIEVILDVVYNHTGEGDEQGPTFNFKGIDCATYYIPSGDPASPFADFSGTGNTFDCSNRTVRRLVVDSLRYWVREMHVDGFRFDLASVFSRNEDGSINFDDPPIIGDIGGDPSLVGVRLIAEPWEGNPKYPNYQLGSVPGQRHFSGDNWRQWNDKFRTTVRKFVKSDSGVLSDCITRLYGSADLFPDTLVAACRPWQSLNYIASHDGLTLYDLVSYTTPESWNCGGPDGEACVSEQVMQLRKQQVKNFCCVLMLSNGTPMFRAGDEFLQTQQGESNPYNIDGPLTWLDWTRLKDHQDIFRFFSSMIAFRSNHPSIGRSTFWRDDVVWYGVKGGVDFSWDSHSFAYCLHGAFHGDNTLYVMINSYWEPLAFDIQESKDWKRVIDTSQPSPEDFCDESSAPSVPATPFTVQPRSIVVLIA